MMRKISRITSALLAAVMLISMLPAGFAGAEDAVSLKYVFSAPAIGLEDGTTMSTVQGTAADNSGKGLEDIVPEISAPWDITAFRSLNGGRYYTDGIAYNTKDANARVSNRNGLAFKITVDKEATYTPSVSFDYAATGGIVSVYLFDEATATAKNLNMEHQYGIQGTVNNLEPIGSFETYDAEAANSSIDKEGSASFAPMELTAGAYYLVFSIAGLNEALAENTDAKYIELRGFELNEVVTKTINYVFSSDAVGLADATKLSLAKDENGKTTTADGSGKGLADIVPEISAPWDLTAFRSLNGGYYYKNGIAYNTTNTGATIFAGNGLAFKITTEEGLFTPSVSFDYAPTGGIVSAYLFDEATATAKNLNMELQTGIQNTVLQMDPMGSFDTHDAEATNYKIDQPGYVSFDPVELTAGTYYLVFSITGLNEALAENTATKYIELRGFTLTEAPPEAKVEKVTYDFRNGPYDKGVDTVTDYSLTENWKYHSMEPGLFEKYQGNYKFARYLAYGIQFQSAVDEWLALTLDVPAGGFYIVDFKHTTSSGGSMGDLYLAPASVASESWFNDEYHIGEVDFHSASTVNNLEKELRAIKLDSAGEYVFVLKSREGAAYPTSLTLTSAEATGVDVIFDEEYLRVGATEQVVMKVATNKERSVDVVGAAPTFTSSDDSIATVTDDGVLRGVGAGTVTITAETTVYGQKLSGSKTIEVKDISYGSAEVNLTEGESFYVGGQKALVSKAFYGDGSEIKPEDITISYASSDENVIKIENGTLYAVGEGSAKVTASVQFGEEVKTVERNVKVEAVKLSYITAKTEDNVVSSFDADGSKIVVTGINNDGSTADLTGAACTFESLTPATVSVDGNGYAHYVSRGEGKIKVSATIGGITFECECAVIPSSHKTEPTVYTNDMRAAALTNTKKYDWAKELKDTAVKNAEQYLANLDFIYNNIPGEGIPRANHIALRATPELMQYSCPHPNCQVDVRKDFHTYGWIVDPIAAPWKVQCPGCKRLFPSNDFESFYKLGLQPDGTFDRAVAMQKNAEIVAAGGKGYLVNERYPEMPEDWLVDDGFGWSVSQGYGTMEKTAQERTDKLCFVSYYVHWLWGMNGTETRSFITKALNTLRDAYLYTGDEKYGRAGAILIDRVADVYPTYEFEATSINYPNSQGGRNSGKILGCIWEPELAEMFVRAYDAFYPMFDDAQVISYLSAKSAEFGQANPKTSGDMIRENVENGIVREVFEGSKNGKIWGNFPMQQLTVSVAAAALDTYPETQEMFDWLFEASVASHKPVTCPIYGTSQSTYTGNSGGSMVHQYIQLVDRDGFGNEVGVGYNKIWLEEGIELAEVLNRYGAGSGTNLFENPKFRKMFNTFVKETMGDGYTIQIGDSGGTASAALYSTAAETLRAYNATKDPVLAQNYYYMVGGDLDDVYIDIFTNNDGLKESIQNDIDKYGELKLESDNLTGFGLATLRGGELIKGSGVGNDSERRYDTWMYYGITNTAHAHQDMLALGIDAYGFNFMPDLGYPEATSYDPNRYQWVKPSLSHNTVTVNDATQTGISGGNPLHFDDSGKVKVIDTEAKGVYAGVDTFRRTAVTVEESAEVAYTIDFFRVKGGDKHTYSFHTQSHNGYSTDDFELVEQPTYTGDDGELYGTYAGPDVKYGPDPNTPYPTTSDCVTMYPRGYTWLTNVNRAENLTDGSFSVNFKQTDFNKQVNDSKGLNLKFTALNDWTPSEVAITTGYAPRTSGNQNVTGLDYMFIHREGKALDTLFTSVLQPYKGEEYIAESASVPVLLNGNAVTDNSAKAVRVTLKNGRTDYVVYSTDDTKTYTISDTFTNTAGEDVTVSFNFSGFVGVYSVNQNGDNIYSYINDGTLIGDTAVTGEYTGTVVEFTEELSLENSITVKFDGEVDTSNLENRYIYVANDGVQNGAYKILSAEQSGENVVLNLGDVSVIRDFADATNVDLGYVYNIAKGQKFSVPLPVVDESAPEFAETNLDNLSTSAGKTITVSLSAEGTGNVTYIGTIMPRGASINAETGVVTWKPDASQVGEAGFLITARDETGAESTISFEVNVYGSTTGGSSSTDNSGTSDSEGTSGTSGGGGGGGGGGTSGGGSTDGSDTGTSDSTDNTDNTTTDDGTTTPSDGSENASGGAASGNVRFIDLGNHAWAADAVNALAEDGIIKGTTASTYSPANNITRADYAILLVRAFDLTSDDTTNFADVSASDYFAAELAVARNTGIVKGIGDNKYAPRKTITRQDMMVVIYRALKKLGKLGDTDAAIDASAYPDYADVADYARDAVNYLIANGLVNGKNGRIAPTDYTTRAEVAVLLKRILDYVK